MKKYLKVLVVLSLVVFLVAACAPTPAEEPAEVEEPEVVEEVEEPEVAEDEEILIAFLPKSIGGAWFTRMFAGFERYAANNPNVTTIQIGASEGDAALQNAAIEDFITQAQGVKAGLAITFVSPEATEQTTKKAMDAGIVVIGNEAPAATNVDYDIEAFDIPTWGAALADEMANGMGGEGEYLIMVGKLSSAAHMAWAGALQENLEANYPNITLVQDPYPEGNYDQQASYEKMTELLKLYPDLKGVFCTSATDSAGIARAIDDAGVQEQTYFITFGTPDLYEDFLKSGATDVVTGWDPSMMGEAMANMIVKILNGETIENGADLGAFGFDEVIVDGKLVKGNSWQRITVENVDEILERDY
jgi:simple sugar transport system substrate-binding protein